MYGEALSLRNIVNINPPEICLQRISQSGWVCRVSFITMLSSRSPVLLSVLLRPPTEQIANP